MAAPSFVTPAVPRAETAAPSVGSAAPEAKGAAKSTVALVGAAGVAIVASKVPLGRCPSIEWLR